jgi:hypothetical protein
MLYDNFPAYLFPMVEISWWNPSPCLSLTAPRFRRKKSKWECKNESSMTYYTPYSGMHLTSPPLVPSSYQLLHFQGNLDTPLWILAMQISQFLSTGVQIDQISWIYGPQKTHSFNLPSLSFRNFSLKYLKPLPRFFIASTQIFIKSNLMCSGKKKSYLCELSVDFLHAFPLGLSFLIWANL